MANKRIQDLPAKGATIASNDILELSEYQSPGVYISKKILGSELGGVTTFEALTDTPAYSGNALKVVRVNAGENALEYATITANSGLFGIADSSGVYTYYTTLTLAMTAATSGQTIEMFTDYTETGAVTITLKDGVTINGNGHTYKMTYAGATNMLEAATTNGVYHLKNINIVKTNNTSGSAIFVSVNGAKIYANGSTFVNCDGTSGSAVLVYGSQSQVYNLTVVASGTNIGINATASSSELHYCNAKTTGVGSTSFAIVGGILFNCVGNAIGSAGISVSGSAYFCCGIGVGSYGGLYVDTNAKAYNSIGKSANGRGLVAEQGYIYNCIGEGTLEGILGGYEVHNCKAYSSGNFGLKNTTLTAKISNTVIISGGSSALNINPTITEHQVKGCTIESTWNNATGHAILYTAGGNASAQTVSDIIVNNHLKVVNSSANAVNYVGGGAQLVRNVKLANNSFEGSTTALTVDVNQSIVNSSDTKGNILI